MKKLISLALTLAILATLAISVSAAPEHVVGSHGEHAGGTGSTSYNDGLALGDGSDGTWDGSSNSAAANVNVYVTTGAYEHRYAVDIEYSTIEFNVSGSNMVWDVNKLQYVAADPAAPLTKPADQNITVRNYSDMPVNVSANVAPQAILTGSPLTVEATPSNGGVVAKATAASVDVNTGNPVAGSPTEEKVAISLVAAGNDWYNVAAYFANKLTPDTSTLAATVTLTITA